MNSRIRTIALSLGIAASLISSAGPAARAWDGHPPRNAPRVFEISDRNHFEGEVVGLNGPAENPTRITIALGTAVMQMPIAPQAVLVACSGEADVEGLQVQDFAVITGKRGKGGWMATKIQYDVVPVAPLRFINGAVRRVDATGKRITIKPDKGAVVTVRTVPQTLYIVDGQATENPPQIAAGSDIQVLAKRMPGDLIAIAYDVAIKTSP